MEGQESLFSQPETVADDGFERFWRSYPRKRAKVDALKAWRKLKPDPNLIKIILSSIERHKGTAQWCEGSGDFIPYPATFIRQRRWEDELQCKGLSGQSARQARNLEAIREGVNRCCGELAGGIPRSAQSKGTECRANSNLYLGAPRSLRRGD